MLRKQNLRVPTKSIRWTFFGSRRQEAAELFHQQLFLLGRDVVSKRGNLMIEYGCEREKSPYRGIPSIYTFPISKRRRLVFRGFGIYCSDDSLGGVFVSRREFRVMWTEESRLKRHPWIQDMLPKLRPPKNSEQREAAALLVGSVLDWLIAYEAWIDADFGFPLRRGQLAYFQRRGHVVHSWHPIYGWQRLRDWLSDS